MPDPQHDLPRTMSKFIAAGMSETEVFARATLRPAELLGLLGLHEAGGVPFAVGHTRGSSSTTASGVECT